MSVPIYHAYMCVCISIWSFGIGYPEKTSHMGRNLTTLNYDKVKKKFEMFVRENLKIA